MVDLPAFTPDAVFAKKKDSFERSTLIEILVQLGATKAAAKRRADRLGPAFTAEWFNDRALITPLVEVDRLPSYALDDLLFQPQKSPLLSVWRQLVLKPGRHLLVIKYVTRRLVVAGPDDVPEGWPHLCCEEMAVMPFNGYFTERFGAALDDEQEL